jgi:hypothetical protein
MLRNVYTGHYRYSGPDRVDITVKGQDKLWKLFAPNWSMVMDFKNGLLSEDEYTKKYLIILDGIPVSIWTELFKMETATLVCFCPKGAFCHRNILMNYICQSVAGVEYMGWR